MFKHALVQDAAYGTLLRSRHQQLHARIAATLEDRFPEIVLAQPALLARQARNDVAAQLLGRRLHGITAASSGSSLPLGPSWSGVMAFPIQRIAPSMRDCPTSTPTL